MKEKLETLEFSELRDLGYALEPVVGRNVRGQSKSAVINEILEAVEEGAAEAKAIAVDFLEADSAEILDAGDEELEEDPEFKTPEELADAEPELEEPEVEETDEELEELDDGAVVMYSPGGAIVFEDNDRDLDLLDFDLYALLEKFREEELSIDEAVDALNKRDVACIVGTIEHALEFSGMSREKAREQLEEQIEALSEEIEHRQAELRACLEALEGMTTIYYELDGLTPEGNPRQVFQILCDPEREGGLWNGDLIVDPEPRLAERYPHQWVSWQRACELRKLHRRQNTSYSKSPEIVIPN